MADTYKADVSASECWARLNATPNAYLVDVRTRPEWTFVGLPRMEPIGKAPILAEWQVYPTMSIDPNFVSLVAEAVAKAGGDRESEIYFLCRSGQRSMAAAAAMAAEGYENCFNIAGGFEGPPDAKGQRGKEKGWKAEGLPWAQS